MISDENISTYQERYNIKFSKHIYKLNTYGSEIIFNGAFAKTKSFRGPLKRFKKIK